MIGIIRLNWLYGLSIMICSTVLANSSIAQISPDTTLPNNSNVKLEGSTNVISGGTTAGANLFHSFSEFSVPTGWEAFFKNTSDIQNILTRVTGTKASNIDGLIRTSGKANLFLMNPNGISFGENASLNIGGSFVASTASAVKFASGFEFSAKAPQSQPLLTISLPIGLQYGNNPGKLEVKESVLRVKPSQTLALVGGNINIQGGKEGLLRAEGGRIELGGLTSAGMVGIEGEQSEGMFKMTTLRFPDVIERADVFINNYAYLNVRGGGSGSIAINARNLEISGGNFGGSQLLAGIAEGKVSLSAIAGDITLNATGKITVADKSDVSNNVEKRAIGDAGNINITTASLEVTSGAQVLARNNGGRGNAGSVTINASDTVYIEALKGNGEPTIGTDVTNEGVGNGNDIKIKARSVVLNNDAVIAASIIDGKGEDGKFAQAGNVNITADNQVSLNNGGRIYSEVGSNSVGNGGTINITAPSVSLENSSYLITRIKEGGQGNAGNVKISASDSVLFANSDILSTVEADAIGSGGNIDINTASFTLKNGAQVLARNNGGRGNAGSVTINASDTVYIEALKGNGEPTIGTDVADGGVGNGNDINIKARSVVLNNDAVIAASIIDGKGEDGKFAQAGNVNITADNQVLLDNGGRIYSEVGSNSVGNGGTINITAPSVVLENSSYLITRIKKGGQGNAGNVKISASDSVLFARSDILSTVEADAIGSGGNIDINTPSLTLKNGAQILARNNGGRGNAGSVTINASDTVYIEALEGNAQATIGSDVTNGGVGNGNDINIKARSIVLNNDAIVAASILNGKGEDAKFAQAGNVNIAADNQVVLNNGGRIYSEVGSNSVGNGGTINITAPSVLLENSSYLITRIREGGQGQAGGINITTGRLEALSGTQVLASTFGQGNAGNVKINASDSVLFAGSDIFSRVGAGAIGLGGNIDINAASLSFKDGAQVSANTSGQGSAGNIQLKGTESISISGNGSMISAETRSRSTGGNLTVNTRKLTVQDGAQVSVSSVGSGKAGALTVNANSIKLDNQGKIRADTRGGGGNIFLNSSLLLLRRDSSITTNASGNNITGGNINIDAQNGFIVAVPSENSDIAADSANSRGGNVIIKNIAGIFGIQARKEPSPNTSDISAKGATPDLSGNIQITRSDVEPSSLIELPVNLVDASNQISNACTPGSRQFDSTFTATGRGGLPISPTEPLQDQSTYSAWVRFNETKPENSTTVRINQPSLVAAAPTIIEASTWIANKSGNIELVAPASQTPQQAHSISCHASQ